ncbi:hypothetical protein MED01_002414 [Micromonospora sp. MED01]|uniref:hypothetical protein n=1 Tax=Micromonospora alfalfae TaxID=2911212 RepID=UPI001EE8077B|nr:hypothetical protein [Micromonospora alfalfae]MCG5464249.1 hypothetical protein [Micromonospora alfalfae]
MTDMDVPAGTLLHLRADEIRPNPTRRDEAVWAVAVYNQPIGGMVWMRGHTCGPAQDCAAAWCFEAQVLVAAVEREAKRAR